jgi:hypothetical protein
MPAFVGLLSLLAIRTSAGAHNDQGQAGLFGSYGPPWIGIDLTYS